MIMAKMETSHFSFVAFGTDKDDAINVMRAAWDNVHRKHYPDAVSFDEYVGTDAEDELNFYEVEVGCAYRDGEPLQ